jgi:hypothetical protein
MTRRRSTGNIIDVRDRQLASLPAAFFADAGDVIQIAYSLHQVIVRLERMTIDIQSRCEISSPNGTRYQWEPELLSDMRGFGELLGSRIERFEAVAGVRLILYFSNGGALLLAGKNSGYESFIISKEGGYGDVII